MTFPPAPRRRALRPRLRDALVLLVGGLFVATKGHDLAQRQADSAASAAVEALAAVPATLAADVALTSPARAGRHLGFDTYAYPGDAAMLAWRHRDVPYEWVGYYLPAPCHKGSTWSGKRQRLEDMGWGLAVIYVGQQAWEQMGVPVRRNPRAHTAAGRRDMTVCARPLLGAERGRLEADDAIARTLAEGFPHGTAIFLDVERMERVPQAMRDYYRAWTARVLADGRFRPGYYVHKHNAALIHGDVKAEYAAAGRRGEPPFWVASGRDFHEDRWPHEVGHQFAGVWQGVLDVVQEWNGVKLPIDVNVAAVPSPSSHEYAAAE